MSIVLGCLHQDRLMDSLNYLIPEQIGFPIVMCTNLIQRYTCDTHPPDYKTLVVAFLGLLDFLYFCILKKKFKFKQVLV